MKPFTIVTSLLATDPNITTTAESILPQIKGGKASWLVKCSSNSLPTSLMPLFRGKGVKIITEADNSLYQGLNQSLPHIEGEFFMVVGAGDTVEPGAIDFIHDTLEKNPLLNSFFFAVTLASSSRILAPRPNEIRDRMACPHPGALLRTLKVRELGGFDESYQIASDYDLLSRYLSRFGDCGWADQPVVRYKGGGLSDLRALEGYLEEELIRLRVWQTPQKDVCSRGLKFLTFAAARLGALSALQ